jgi:hypothetical protein
VPSSGIHANTVRPTKEVLLEICASRERLRYADDDNPAEQNRSAQGECLRDNGRPIRQHNTASGTI